MQIFYPFSLQTHPNTFPGESPQDCPRDVKHKKASSLNCSNSAWPDVHGHYREAQFTQVRNVKSVNNNCIKIITYRPNITGGGKQIIFFTN